MGFMLYREIRDGAPADWTAAERLVAWVIADDANDTTRKSWIKLPELMQRTGIKSEVGVRKALQRLAARGYEFRVPISKGKDGRLVFAAKGHSLDFIVPPMPDRRLPAGAFEGDPSGSPNEAKGDTPGSPFGSAGDPSGSPNTPKAILTDLKGDPSGSPLSSAPLLKDQNKASRRGRASGSAAALTDDQKINGARFAIAETYGEVWNKTVSDEEVLALFNLKAPANGKPVRSTRAYMAKIFADTPDFDTLLAQLDGEDGADDYDLGAEIARAGKHPTACPQCFTGDIDLSRKTGLCGECSTAAERPDAAEGWNRSILNAVIVALRDRTGYEADDRWAARVAAHILDQASGVRQPWAYIRKVIADDPDPRRFTPTPSP